MNVERTRVVRNPGRIKCLKLVKTERQISARLFVLKKHLYVPKRGNGHAGPVKGNPHWTRHVHWKHAKRSVPIMANRKNPSRRVRRDKKRKVQPAYKAS